MNKAFILLVLTALITGCQSSVTAPKDNGLVRLGCLSSWDKDIPISRAGLEFIRQHSASDTLCKILLADLYERGHSVGQDIPRARALYQSAARQDVSAYFHLGRMAQEGVGEPTDYVKAREYYQLSASKPENNASEVQLAGLMENSQGGPQDLEGALTLYLKAVKYIGDDAWVSVQRIRAKGLALTSDQKKRYNEIWVYNVHAKIRAKVRSLAKTLVEQAKLGAAGQPTKFQLEYTTGSLIPRVSLLESSGDGIFDQMLLQGLSTLRFPDEPIVPEGENTFKVIHSVTHG